MRTRLGGATAVALAALAASPAAPAAIFTVNTTNDAVIGACDFEHCSLREAITAANTAAGPDTVAFAILGGGLQTIRPTSQLPALTGGTSVDGTTQPGYDAQPLIELDGSLIEVDAVGLQVFSDDTVIRGLTINRFRLDGIRIGEGSSRVRVERTWIGVDASGTAAAGNGGYGVLIWEGADETVVGGEPAERNVISGNGGGGFSGVGIFLETSTGNSVRNNWIGVGANGTARIGNTSAGVVVNDAVGSGVHDNVLAANGGYGLILVGTAADTAVTANAIGLDPAGAPAGNGDGGIWIQASGNTIGPANTVRNNGGEGGIIVAGGSGNDLTQNSISENDGLGIDLVPAGVTANDELDADEGANGLQNWPQLTGATNGSGGTAIEGVLSSRAATAYRVEYFRSPACDPGVPNGEGSQLLGSQNVVAGDDGTTSVALTLGETLPVGTAITATATDPDGSTSEFSNCVLVTGEGEPPPSGTFTVNSADDATDGVCDLVHCSLREALAAANTAAGANTIAFSVGTGPITIQPATPLPLVAGPTMLDATTQPGYDGRPIVFVDGGNLETLSVAFFVSGGSTTIRGFVISRFRDGSILLNAPGNTVEGNWLGLDPTGKLDFGNGLDGIQLAASDGNTISGNVISGNGRGISLFIGSDTNTITGNLIGTDADGGAPIPNANAGIVVQGTGNTIGGEGAAQNTIASSGSHGVQVLAESTGTRIGPNRIHDNGGLGIELGSDGVTPNDAGDADAGANEGQNFPDLASAVLGDGSTRIVGTLSSRPATTYRVDLYASASCDPSGHGEGARWLGSVERRTNADGVVQIDTGTGITVPVSAGEAVTGTATDPAGNTSEFSACVTASGDGGALEPLTAPSQCPTAAVDGALISFEDDGGSLGVPLPERYAFLGVHFVDDEQRTPVLQTDEARGAPTQSPPASLLNRPDGELTSDDVPLEIRFDRPQTAVGFYLAGNDEPPVEATVRALGAEGEEIGSLATTATSRAVTHFFGVRADEASIYAVRIDYGGSEQPEEIDDLCFTATEPEAEPAADVELTSDRRVLPVAAQLVPLSAVPANQLPAYSGSPGTGPVGSIPIGSVPIGSVPIGSVPIGSVPIGSVPIGSVPIGSVPIGSVPIGSVGLSAIPIGSVGLDQVQLSSLPVDWSDVLVAPHSTLPLQTLTLADVYANPTERARFEALTLAESGLSQSILGSVTFAAILLGRATLAQLPPPGASTWCAAIQNAGGSCAGVNTATNTVVGLSIAGVPIASVPIGSIPIASVPIGSVPIGSVPIASVDLAASRLAAIRIATIGTPNDVVDCARISCTGTATLGDAAALTPSAIRPAATLADLVGAFPANLTLNDLILGILPRSALAWEAFPLDGLQLYAGTGDEIRYTLSFDLACPMAEGFAAGARLPTGYIVKRGTTRVRYGSGAAVDGPDPATSAKTGARWTSLPGSPCAGAGATRRVHIDFTAVGGYTLGVHTSSATVTVGGVTRAAADQAPVLTRQNWEPNDEPGSAPVLAPNQLAIVHVASSGDDEVFRVAIPSTPGTRTTFLLSHIAEGADFDLVVQQPATTSLQSSPIASVPIASVPVEDHGSGLDSSPTTIPPETLQDIPIGSVPIGSVPIASVSANRGDADELAEVVSAGESGFYTVTIRGYNGSHSDLPAVLRVKVTPPPALPPCPARTFPNPAGTQGALPAALPGGTKTLFLLNRERLNRLYGQTATDSMRTQAQALLGRAEVAGALLEVDGDADVRAAYAAWDASPCSPEAANAVVRAINAVVARYRTSLPALRYVVLLGTDEALPMARISDPVTISNETDEASDLAFTTAGLTRGNALHAAAVQAKFLSDAPYGTLAQIPWLGRQLYLPELAVGRLVETPLDIERQLALYVSANGMLSAGSALTTAYDFLTDGGQAVDAELTALTGGNATRLLDDTWTATELKSAFTEKPVPDSVLSVNAHYNHWLLQPASGTALVSSGDLPALPTDPAVEPAFARRIVFTMGCHAGLNVANTLIANPSDSQAARLRDWAQSYGSQRAAVYVANTGFGYGDTVSNALSERLMGLFAARLRESRPIGESWVTALGDYFLGAGAYGVYDEKVLEEATFYGLPFWQLGGTSPAPTPTPPTLTPDPVSGLQVARLTMTPGLTERATPRGRFWTGDDGTVDIHYRPIQPRTERDVTVPGLTAHGVIVTALATNDVGGVDPATSLPTIDLSEHEPERDFRDTVFPASIVNLTRARGTLGERQWLVVTGGQFRPSEPPAAAGIERLVLSGSFEVAYSSSADFSPPGIEFVGATFDGATATIVVETSEPVRRVAAVFNDTTSWRFTELTNVAGTNRWTASVAAGHAIEVAAMAQDAAGNVGHSTNKGFNFTSVADSGGPEILIEAPGPGQAYTLGSVARASYACSDPAGVVSCTGPVPSGGLLDTGTPGLHTFTVTATDTGGRTSTETREYVVRYAFSRFLPPIDNPPTLNVATAGRTYPVKWQLRDASGAYTRSLAAVRRITVSVIDCADRPADPVPDVGAGSSSGLRYDATAEQYVYTWTTLRAWAGSCRRLTIELDDGSKPYADFSFR